MTNFVLDDLDGYRKRKGLEGPYRLADRQVYYFDPAEKKYYNPRTDIYVDTEHEEYLGNLFLDLFRNKEKS